MPTLRAFLVEDSPVIRENLIAALEEMVSLQVVGWAEDEPAALAWLDEPGHECDLLIVDILLRKGSGLGVLRALQQREGASERVVFTNYATPDLRRRCLALGASRVFDKSSEIDDLVAHCSQLTGSSRSSAHSK